MSDYCLALTMDYDGDGKPDESNYVYLYSYPSNESDLDNYESLSVFYSGAEPLCVLIDGSGIVSYYVKAY